MRSKKTSGISLAIDPQVNRLSDFPGEKKNPESVALIDPDGRIQSANDVFARLFNRSATEIINQFMYEIMPASLAASWRDRINAVVSSGNAESFEEIREERYLEHYLHPLLNANGGCAQIALFSIDRTERRKIEAALRQSEEKHRELFDNAPVGYHEIDTEGRIVSVNRTELEMFGYRREEMIGQFVWRFAMDSTAAQKQVLAKLSERLSVTRNAERRYLRKDGTSLSVLLDERLLKAVDGTVTGILAVLQDINDRKFAEEELHASEERFKTTLYSIGDGVITTDTNAKIEQMNPVAESMTGWTEQDARGRSIEEVFQVVNEETGLPVENPATRVLRDGVVVGLANHTIQIARDGTRRAIANSGAPIRNSQGETTGVVLVFNDQSDRRLLQAQLVQSQKMEAVGRLAGGVAHDFNNIIAIILGYAKLLEHELSPLDPIMKKVQAIVSAAERSAALTRQLLAFARKQEIQPITVNLNESLETIRSMLTRLVGEDISINIHPGKDLWNVRIDPSQVDQVLANLATNARDAIKNVGTISIETSNTTIDESYSKEHVDFHAGEFVMLAFGDTGEGLDKATAQRIFEPFFTTKPKGEGSGLGLATVFGIVKQNNGFINVYSEVGKGTIFKIYFPRQLGGIETPVERAKQIPLQGNETILVVEDEEQLLDLARTSLQTFGYTVYAAKSPGDAVVLCERSETKFDLLVTDVIMPGMNGKELTERLHKKRPDMRVIFMSGYTADIVTNRGVLDEKIDFLQKPFTPLTLARKVRDVLNACAEGRTNEQGQTERATRETNGESEPPITSHMRETTA